MSDSKSTDEALERVREAFDDAAAEADQMSDAAKQEVNDAIDALEDRIDGIRQ